MTVEKKVGRNALCPCKSGKKHKLCCLVKQAAATPSVASADAPELQRLKADAYDCLAQIEHWQARLRQVNERIAMAVQQAAQNRDNASV